MLPVGKRYVRPAWDKTCYCHTCDKDFHYLGINRHRAMHRDKREDCTISYTKGDTYDFNFSEIDDE